MSFNIRSYGKNLDPEEDTVAKQALNLLLHSLGVVLTSVQETEMKYMDNIIYKSLIIGLYQVCILTFGVSTGYTEQVERYDSETLYYSGDVKLFFISSLLV